MKFLLLLPILLLPIAPPQDPTGDDSAPVAVVSFKWYKDRKLVEMVDNTVSAAPVAAVTPASKSFERQRRINESAGMRDPNADTIDARSANLARINQEAREEKPPPVDGYTYQAKVLNKSPKVVKAVFLEFQFAEKTNPANVSRRQFVCRTKVKPDKHQDFEIFSRSAPNSVVTVGSLKKNTTSQFQESLIINRVEYDDGTIWQRKGWNFDEVKLTIKPASNSNTFQPCRGL